MRLIEYPEIFLYKVPMTIRAGKSLYPWYPDTRISPTIFAVRAIRKPWNSKNKLQMDSVPSPIIIMSFRTMGIKQMLQKITSGQKYKSQ